MYVTKRSSQAARSAGGGATLDRDTLSGFTTVPFPAIASTNPFNGQLADRWQRGLTIRFASPMDWSTLEDRLLIDPAPERIDYFSNNNSFELYANFELERNTEYTITVPGDAADPRPAHRRGLG